MGELDWTGWMGEQQQQHIGVREDPPRFELACCCCLCLHHRRLRLSWLAASIGHHRHVQLEFGLPSSSERGLWLQSRRGWAKQDIF